MTLRRVGVALLVVGLWFALYPAHAFAWTPGTHIYLGESLLANLELLPPSVATLLQAFPYDFLYGSIAPDTSIAKKYVPKGRHSHFWAIGQEVLHGAPSDSLRAFGLGYLAHLAADTVAHNFFIPRQLILTTSTRTMGHTYWESRAETHLGIVYSRRAREIIRLDQSAADRHLERIISPTIFSVRTNRRLFRGLVHLTDTTGWRNAMRIAGERSRWLLDERDVERHLGIAYDLTVDALAGLGAGESGARALAFDPNGAHAISAAKRLRRRELEQGHLGSPTRLLDLAEARFGVRSLELGYWARSKVERPWLTPGEAISRAS